MKGHKGNQCRIWHHEKSVISREPRGFQLLLDQTLCTTRDALSLSLLFQGYLPSLTPTSGTGSATTSSP